MTRNRAFGGCAAWMLAAVAGSALLGFAPDASAGHKSRSSCGSRSGVSVSIGVGSHFSSCRTSWGHRSSFSTCRPIHRRPVICHTPVRRVYCSPRPVCSSTWSSWSTWSSPVYVRSYRVVTESPSAYQRFAVVDERHERRPVGVSGNDFRAWQVEQALASRVESIQRDRQVDVIDYPVVVETASEQRAVRPTASQRAERRPLPDQRIETAPASMDSGPAISQPGAVYQGVRGAHDALAAGDYRAAQELYGEAAAQNPEQMNVRVGYAIAAGHLADLDGAIWALGRALESNPRAFEPTIVSSDVREGLTDLAMSLRVQLQDEPTGERWLLLAAIEHLRLKSSASEEAWRSAREAGADSKVLRNLGIALGIEAAGQDGPGSIH